MCNSRSYLIAYVGAAMALTLGACSNDDSANDPSAPSTHTRTAQHYPSLVSVGKPFVLTDAQQAGVTANNAFALDILGHILDDAPTGSNTVFSPISLTIALAFAADGAEGDTRSEIIQTLGLDDSEPDGVNKLCATIMQSTLHADTAVRFNIANAFFLNSLHGFNMLPDYVHRLHGYYDADIEAVDFRDKSSLGHINAWCERQTDGMIPSVLSELKPEVVAYLLNATYMEARWGSPFKEDLTEDAPFYAEGGQMLRSVKMMQQVNDFPYLATDTYQAIRLNYTSSTSPFGMTVVLPREGHTVADVLNSLKVSDLDAVVEAPYTLTDLQLPRFTTDVRTELIDILQTMGIHEAFDSDNARFTRMVDAQLFISQIFQKARIEVTENSTKAAAVTVIGLDVATAGPFEEPQVVTFHANRPFLYFITERTTGTIYFMGSYYGN